MLSKVTYVLLLLYLAYLIVMVSCMLTISYNSLIYWFSSLYPDAYLIDQYGATLFTESHFQSVQRVGWPLLVTLCTIIILLLRRRQFVLTSTDRAFRDFIYITKLIARMHPLNRQQGWFLGICVLLILFSRIYLFIELPYHVDETFSFVTVVDKGFFHTNVYSYKANHILYNLASALWWKAGLPAVVAMRITSFLAGVLLMALIFFTVRHFYNFMAAVMSVFFTGMSYWACVYSVEGRGYMLMSLFCVASIIAWIFYIKENRGYILFIIFSLLGFYCVRIFLVPFLAIILSWIAVILNEKNFKKITQVVKACALVASGSLLLYLPAFLWQGSEAIFLNGESIQYRTGSMPDFFMSPIFLELLSVITGANAKSYLVFIITLSALSVIAFRNSLKDNLLLILNINFMISLIAIVSITHICPPFRGIIYHNILFSCTLAIVVNSILDRVRIVKSVYTLYLSTLLLVMCLKTYQLSYSWREGWQRSLRTYIQDTPFYTHIDHLVNEVMSHRPKKIFIAEQNSYLNFYLQLYVLQHKRPVNFIYQSAKARECDVNILGHSSMNESNFSSCLQDDTHGIRLCMKIP